MCAACVWTGGAGHGCSCRVHAQPCRALGWGGWAQDSCILGGAGSLFVVASCAVFDTRCKVVGERSCSAPSRITSGVVGGVIVVKQWGPDGAGFVQQ
jgi:hypothetical protein